MKSAILLLTIYGSGCLDEHKGFFVLINSQTLTRLKWVLIKLASSCWDWSISE